MKVNFFKKDCQTITNERKFGLFDAEDNMPAKIKLTEEKTWNATVFNDEKKTILVTAIDNCIEILRENGETENRCDMMLSYEDNLLFIELKNKRDSWQAEGLAQVEATIKRNDCRKRRILF